MPSHTLKPTEVDALSATHEIASDPVERMRERLTEAGQVLHEYSRTLFGIAEEAAQAIEGMNTLERGRINIAASETIGTNLLPGVMARFQTSHPWGRTEAACGKHA